MFTPQSPHFSFVHKHAFDAELATSFEQQLAHHLAPALHIAFIAHPRQPLLTDWNVCKTCNIEIRVRHIHRSLVVCPSCDQRYYEIHESDEANEHLRADPNYHGPFHDMLSAAWGEWSLRPAKPPKFPDGSLAFDVKPLEVVDRFEPATVTLSRRERRRLARSRGRRKARSVSPTCTAMRHVVRLPPQYLRDYAPVQLSPVLPFGEFPAEIDTRMSTRDYSPTRLGAGAVCCSFCKCDVRVYLHLYETAPTPHLRTLVKQVVARTAQLFARELLLRGQCLCSGLQRAIA